MADFTADFHNMEFTNHFTELAPTVLDTSIVTSLNFHDTFFPNHATVPGFPGNLPDSFYGGDHVPEAETMFPEQRKRKVVDVSESSSVVASNSVTMNKYSSGRAKKMKNSEAEDEKPKDVVHVRARRGQATDSHSLAERVRRGKINDRLRCLQDIVPGCYKTMGLATMLDEIINYVQSLQNQVEFLSMKLTAASSFYDFNSEPDALEKMQRAMAGEAKEMERRMRKEDADSFHPTCPWHL